MQLVTDSEGIEFPIGSMVIKGEYLTQDERIQKKGVYVFQYYRLGEVVYHFTNLVVGTSLQLQKMLSKKSPKVQYFFPYSNWYSQVLFPSPMTEKQHSIMDFTSRTREVVVNFIYFLRNTLFIHASAPSCSPFLCLDSK